MFVDETKIFVKSGPGGSGCVSFCREKYRPKGGPDGGDGGKGGDVILQASASLRTLTDFYKQRHFKAEKGQNGQGKGKHGKDGQDLLLKVPCGTTVKDKEGKQIGDLVSPGDQLVVTLGGIGGRGNARFTSSRRQAPTFAEKGEPAEEKWINLELKLLADVGIVGLPNVGKSTLISKISNAKPKIASYPFTTKIPNLGVVKKEESSLIIADIPGLIEGAHEGKGLGIKFLKHIERTTLLLFLLDLAEADPIVNFETLKSELLSYTSSFADYPVVVAGNKIDLPASQNSLAKAETYFASKNLPFFAISALNGQGLDKLVSFLFSQLKQRYEAGIAAQKPKVFKPAADSLSKFKVTKVRQGLFAVEEKTLERRIAMTDLDNQEAVSYLQNTFRKIGLEEKLSKAGAKDGDTVKIGNFEFEFYPS